MQGIKLIHAEQNQHDVLNMDCHDGLYRLSTYDGFKCQMRGKYTLKEKKYTVSRFIYVKIYYIVC